MLVDVDFSLAMHNRTGKYFIGRELLDIKDLPIGDVYYWLFKRSQIPSGWRKRLIGRAQAWQIKARSHGLPLPGMSLRAPVRPLLHLDPITVATAKLHKRDIVLCHDLGTITHPSLFHDGVSRTYGWVFDRIAEVGPHVVFASGSSEQEFQRSFSTAKLASSRVIFPAIRREITATSAEPIPDVSPGFLLTVGSLGNRKNQARCIRAYARSGLAERGMHYVLCGAREPGAERVSDAAQATPGVKVLDYVTDGQLAWLYSSASGFVLASLLEGFGMPVAEAIARGLVPLVSASGVLREVAGEGALFADPLSEDAILSGMQTLAAMSADEKRARLAALTESIARFSVDAVQASWRRAFAEFSRQGELRPAA